jgi:hypothetical protein
VPLRIICLLTSASLLASAAALAPRAAGAAPAIVVTVAGTVTETGGAPVPGTAVRILKTRTVYSLKSPRSQDQGVEEIRARTDSDGRFSIELTLDPKFPYYYIRFYDPKQFDAVKYRLPVDRDISRAVKEGAPVEVNALLELQPTWPEVRKLVDEYGAASRRGQIVRALGLPTRRVSGEEGREIWSYDAAGVSYVLEGDKVVETHRVPVPAADGSKIPDDAPQPAERVDER